MKARIGFVIFIFVFIITTVVTLMQQAIADLFWQVAQPFLIVVKRSRALLSVQDWSKIRISFAGWKNFLQKAS